MSSQVLAGAVMWIPSAFLSSAAVLYIAVDWFRKDEARRVRTGGRRTIGLAAAGLEAGYGGDPGDRRHDEPAGQDQGDGGREFRAGTGG